LAALGFAYLKAKMVAEQPAGTDKMKEIAAAIREGAMAYLGRQYRALIYFVVVVAVLLAVGYAIDEGAKALIALSFVCGATASGLAGLFGMRVATNANVRTTNAARDSMNKALRVAFNGGTVMGMSVVGLGVVGLSLLMIIYSLVFGAGADGEGMVEMNRVLQIVAGFSLGASSIALFARVGGGIYTKAADVGADLVGKVEAGIPEDDPRNPATIADNVGDNVGDVAGMGADLCESYVGAIVSAMILGWTWSANSVAAGGDANMGPIYLPLSLAALGILVSMAGTYFVRTREGANPHTALNIGTFAAAGLMIVGTLAMAYWLVPDGVVVDGKEFGPIGVFLAVVGGLVAGTAIGLVTEYYTSYHRRPVKNIADQSLTGPATNIISGLAVGMQSTAIPIVLLGGAILLAYNFAGLYGIALAGLGMLSTTGIQLAVDAYGPIADNAGGIAEMGELPKEVRERTDQLDAVGNTTAAIGKGFAIGSAALTALALFSAFRTNIGMQAGELDLLNPIVMVGVFIGAMMAYLFSSMSMNAVGRAAGGMVDEVRRQFKEIKGLLEGKAKADYRRCVDISTQAAIKEMKIPGVLAVAVPVLAGLADPDGLLLGGVLAGVTASGVLLALFMANAGGAWDNAKKHIEGGAHGGKNSPAHKAAVVGDTVGDPFKDTAGPSLNILMKLMSVVALVMAPILLSMQGDEAGTEDMDDAAEAEEAAQIQTVTAEELAALSDEGGWSWLLTAESAESSR
jgi:K(+)-stimulated pyrophosphate-energized sodium pump